MIKSIKAHNFLSWENLEFEVTTGVTLIDGFNEDDQTSEGSGKSAVLNALSWCIYGKLPKDAKIDEVIKSGEKSCSVTVELSDGKSINRSRKPNDLFLSYDGEKKRGKDAKETQTQIENYVGMSFDTFCQTVYFAQNFNKKFITANQEEKGKILSEIQNLGVFDRARKEAHNKLKVSEDRINSIKVELAELRAKQTIHQNNIENIKNIKKHLEEAKLTEISKKKLEIEELDLKLKNSISQKETLSNTLKQYPVEGSKEQSLRDALEKAKIEISKLDEKLNNYEYEKDKRQNQLDLGKSYGEKYTKLEKLNKQIEENIKNRDFSREHVILKLDKDVEKLRNFIKNPSKECPTCGTTLETFDTSHSKTELSDLLKEKENTIDLIVKDLELKKQENTKEMNSLLQNMKSIKDSLKEELKSPDEVTLEKQKYLNACKQINQSLNLEIEVKNQHDRIIREINTKDAIIKISKEEIETKKVQLEDIKNTPIKWDESKLQEEDDKLKKIELKVSDISSDLLKEKKLGESLNILKSGFKELKSHVFNSALQEINHKLNGYIQNLFEMPIEIKYINENMKIETKILIDGEERGLGLLSGGQFRRASLATDLAIADVVSSRTDSKFGITVLDEYMKDLSESSMNKCLNLLQQRKEPVIMIEHNSIFKQIIDNTFFVRLKDGTSRREN